MRIIVEIEGGCIVGIQADTEHTGPLEVVRVDADCREQGDDAVMGLDYWPVTSEEFDVQLAVERQRDSDMQAELNAACQKRADAVDLSKPCWDIAERHLTPEL